MKLLQQGITYGATAGAISATSLIFIVELLGTVLSADTPPTIEMIIVAAASNTLNRIAQFDEGFVEIAGKSVATGLIFGLGAEVALTACSFFRFTQKAPVVNSVEFSQSP